MKRKLIVGTFFLKSTQDNVADIRRYMAFMGVSTAAYHVSRKTWAIYIHNDIPASVATMLRRAAWLCLRTEAAVEDAYYEWKRTHGGA